MDSAQRHGRPEDELFIPPSTARPQTPSVAPLRFTSSSPPAGNRVDVYPGPYNPQAHEAVPASRSGGVLPYPDSPPYRSAATTNSAHLGAIFSNTARLPADARYHSTGSTGSIERVTKRPYVPSGSRMTSPKPLPASPGPEIPGKEELFTSEEQQSNGSSPRAFRSAPQAQSQSLPYGGANQHYYPSPAGLASRTTGSPFSSLSLPDSQGVNRLPSTASVSTTKAARGSPPPPETPVDVPDIQDRFLASGIVGTTNVTELQAQRLQRAQPMQQQQLSAQSTPRTTPMHDRRSADETVSPLSDSETDPFTTQSGVQIPRVYGQGEPSVDGVASSPQRLRDAPGRDRPIEQGIHGLRVGDEPPPAYASVPQPGRRPLHEKMAPTEAGRPRSDSNQQPNTQDHPAFVNHSQGAPTNQGGISDPVPSNQHLNQSSTSTPAQATPPPPANRSSPPPLPEGWISHLDSNSGHYYYIHLPTQSTQWEFPKGPTPLNLNEPPLSPTGTLVNHSLHSPSVSNFGSKPLMSPGFPYQQSQYADSIYSMGLSSPTSAGFTGPPPSSGIDMYKVAPTNGVYFGPYLRYTNTDIDNGVWFGSIMLVTDTPHPPTIHLHQSIDLSPNPRQLKAQAIWEHQRWTFYRYDIDISMEQDRDAKWTYAITSHLGCTRYEFLVAGRFETSWRFIAHSGNDFALNVSSNERSRLGGVGYMWKDVMQKHHEVGGFHAQLGMGNQMYADRLWKEIPSLRQWTAMSGKDNRKNFQWTAYHEEEVTHAYFHYYTSHLDQPHLREAFAQIPHVLTLDDHDIFDGYGSYPEHMQQSHMFKNIGRIGIEAYLLFQHHTTLEILGNVRNDFDLFTITGNGWHFLKYFGPAVVIVGMDSRSERTPNAVMAGPTYQGLFPKVAILPPHVQHCIWMISVPLIYPRLDTAEQIANTMATGKRAVTGTFNALSKVTSSVAGVVGAKGVVGDGFASVKKAVGKSGLMSNILSPFGELDILDELRDQWTHESKDLERTYLIRTLQGISYNKSLRMTIFSGSTNTCGAGLVYDPSKPSDHKTMYQVISSSIANAPPSPYFMRLFQSPSSSNDKPLYVPMNGHRSHAGHVTDTKEDFLEIFGQDVNGAPRETKRLMGRRNYVAVVAYDPEVVKGSFGQKDGREPGRLSLAVDFMVQGDGGSASHATVKYGPLIIPSLEYGR